MNIMFRIFSVKIIDNLPMMRCIVFCLWEPLGEARSAKVAERINRRSLPNKVCSSLQLDFIYGFYLECI